MRSPPPELVRRLTVRDVLTEAYRETLAFDSPMLHTSRELTLRPGEFVRGYLDGARDRRVTPIKYTLITMTIALVLNQLRRAFFPAELPPNWDAEFANAFYAAQDLFTFILLVVLIPTAALQRLSFRSSGLNFAETYAFNAYIYGHTVWIAIISALLPISLPILQIAGAAIQLAYVTWATCTLYQSYRASVIIRGLLIFITWHMGMLLLMQAHINWLLTR